MAAMTQTDPVGAATDQLAVAAQQPTVNATPTATPAPTAAPVAAPAPTAAPAAATGMIAATPAVTAPAPSPTATQSVDVANETVEGRIGNLLKTDSSGTMTNPVVRQAVEAQQMAFNGRGLLNTSMAQQAGQEAAISQAANIAGQDAKTFTDNRTLLSNQDFQMRKDYQTAVQAVNTNYQKMVDTINASNMTPEDKTVAMQQASQARDGELAYHNNLYANMPRWQSEWSTVAVAMPDSELGNVTSQDTLGNIANDPAQPAYMRQSAAERLQQLRTAAAAPPPAAAAPNGMLWQQPPPSSQM